MMRINDALWALPALDAPALLGALAGHGVLREPPASASSPEALPQSLRVSEKAPQRPDDLLAINGNTAIISIRDVIARAAVYSHHTGERVAVGQDEIAAALDSALRNPKARSILLDINSPGGVVHGVKELADRIAEAAKRKPMAAYANGLMASAAMWLGAATGRVYAPATASVGSIGVIWAHVDWSKINERFGVSVSYVTAGRWKGSGNANQPLSEEDRAYFQRQLDQVHAIFRADVAAGLNITAPAERWADGQILLAGEAQSLGLVTRIVRDRESAVAALSQENRMDYETLAAQHPELLAKIEADATAKASRIVQSPAFGAESVLAIVGAVAGQEAVDKVATLLKAGLSPEQLQVLSPLLNLKTEDAAAQPAAQPAPTAEEQSRAAILAALANASPGPIPQGVGAPPAKQRCALVTDAERRAAKGAQHA